MQFNGEHLFVYGTLLVPQIMRQVSGQRHFSLPATLQDYERFVIRGKRYPGIVPQQGASVEGILNLNVSPAAWHRLDYYEDHFYVRQRVQISMGEGKHLFAWAYIVPASQGQRLSSSDWSLDQFKKRHLQGFMRHLSSRRHS